MVVNCGCGDGGGISDPWENYQRQAKPGETDAHPQLPLLANFDEEEVSRISKILDSLGVTTNLSTSLVGGGGGVTVNCGCCHSDYDDHGEENEVEPPPPGPPLDEKCYDDLECPDPEKCLTDEEFPTAKKAFNFYRKLQAGDDDALEVCEVHAAWFCHCKDRNCSELNGGGLLEKYDVDNDCALDFAEFKLLVEKEEN